ncbi:MFS transporter [Jatrophihabitans cynanchi]|jgi:EmrB/QacA subfamily drug resistance transporter|uniref:MFS transporter n=1 Tax=Jatrophihabitans cynanchi TaxID=2944128 RepID=A0ABY7K0R3_9ACTN|nr:MFS transporter [Jatrophihabitans sp. SB3-54]WAX57770.1 MFS transporter [Jatrophihabitans sp. SB3-54]
MSSHPRRWAALSVIALAQFVVIMDTSIIGVALPRMREDLGFSPDGLQWVFNAFVIAFGGLLLLGGRLSDLLGARRVFSAGWGILLAGSVVSALAGSTGVELVGRAVQGAGSALIAPAALTLLMTLFGGTAELPRALAFYGAAAPAGGTAGVFLGGVITEWLSWPWIFWLYVPIALAVLLAAPFVMPANPGRAGAVDVVGAVTVTGGLALAVLGVVRAPSVGWGSAETLGTLAGAVVLLSTFLVLEAGVRAPLVRLGIFRSPMLGAANLAQLLLGAAWVPLWYFLNLYLQQVLGYGAFASGSALLPMTVLIMVLMVAVAPKLITHFGVKPLIVGGLVALAAGLFWLSTASPTGTFAVDVLPASLVAALGQALAFIPSLGTALSSAPSEDGGLAAGIVNTSYQIGSALGLAAMTAVAATHGGNRVGEAFALTNGYTAAFTGAAVIALAGAVLVAVTLRTPRSGDRDAEDAARQHLTDANV